MRTIGRRELNHNPGQLLDEVEETGEAVVVTSRGDGGVVIRPRSEQRDPLEGRIIRRGKHRLRTKDLPTVPYDGDVMETLDWVKSDRV